MIYDDGQKTIGCHFRTSIATKDSYKMVSQALLSAIKTTTFWALYLGFAATSFLFVEKTILEYLEGNTNYHTTKSKVTAQDIPTFTICLDLKEDLQDGKFDIRIAWITKYVNSSDILNRYKHLREGENTIVYEEPPSKHRLVLKTLKVADFKSTYDRKCFKVSPMEKKLESNLSIPLSNSPDQGYWFLVYFRKKPAPSEAILYITSEENSYGAIFRKWYDGKVKPYTLKNQTGHFLNIEMDEFHHLQSLCKKQFYYQCLASELDKDKSCHSEACSLLTLPTNTRLKDIENCKDEKVIDCKRKLLISLFHNDNVCPISKISKACVIKEYRANDFAAPIRIDGLNGFVFRVAMDPPTSSRDYKVSHPIKTLFTEYYLLTELQLIGTIGGTLGLMIGFSFMGSITSIADFISSLKSRF